MPHSLDEQSSPTQLSLQMHCWVSRSKWPWSEQSGRHWRASSSNWEQSWPFQPFLQMQAPSTQNPWSEQVGSGQSTKEMKKRLVDSLAKSDNRMLTLFTEISCESRHALTLSVLAMPSPAAVRHFTFIMSETALLSLPSRMAFAFSINIISVPSTQKRTGSCTKRKYKQLDIEATRTCPKGKWVKRLFTWEELMT